MKQYLIATRGSQSWQGIPAVERAANGRLWCCFYSGGPREPDQENHLLLTTSDDDGETWSSPQVMVDPPGSARAYDPALWHDPSGQLWLIFNQADLGTKDFSLWTMTTAESHLAEPRWGPPQRIDLGVPFAFRINKPVVLSSGTWVLPVTWARTAPEDWFSMDTHLQGVALSNDQGQSWSLHGEVEAPSWALENMVVELCDGRLWMLMRTGSGVLWQSFSADGGQSWSPGAPTTIVNPGTRFFIHRLASGRLLLINTPHPNQRLGLQTSLSRPTDETVFEGGLVLDPRDQVSYPDAVQAPDGLIYAVHDRERYGAGEILLTVFSEHETMDGLNDLVS